jgi:hypothetical protein
VGSFTGSRYEPRDDTPGILYRQRVSFLDEARLSRARDRRYRAFAGRAYRRETVGRLTLDVKFGHRTPGDALSRLVELSRSDPPMLFTRATLKLLATLIVGRRARRPKRRA